MQKYTISEREAGRRLDKQLNILLPNAGTSFIYKMLRKKNITVNRKKAEGKDKLVTGDSIEMFFSDETYALMSQNTQQNDVDTVQYIDAYNSLTGIQIVYEDDDFIFVNKPVGVLSQKSAKDDFSINEWLIGYLLSENKLKADDLKVCKPAFCNRLDRNTTGFVLGAKTVPALQTLSALLKERTLKKYYLATVKGKPDKFLPVTSDSFWESEAYLIKDHKNNQVKVFSSPDKSGDKTNHNKYDRISTGFRLLNISDNCMTLEVDLHTGKSHQIRAHLAYLKHPIVGDSKYGTDKGGYQMLKAYRVVFPFVPDYPTISNKEFVC